MTGIDGALARAKRPLPYVICALYFIAGVLHIIWSAACIPISLVGIQ